MFTILISVRVLRSLRVLRAVVFVTLFASKVRRAVGISGALVGGDLRIRAQDAGAIGLAVGQVRGGNGVWRLLLLDPLLERRDHVEAGRTVAAIAMVHPRHHEQAIVVLHLRS